MASALLVLGQETPPVPSLTKMPALLEMREAEYPEDLRRLRIEGTVMLALTVDETGEVEKVELVSTSTPAFGPPAMTAATHFRFSPAEAGELGPVSVIVNFRYDFTLQPEVASPPEVSVDAPDPINFVGQLREAGTRAPLGFATVFVESKVETSTGGIQLVQTATEADAQGRFALRGVAPGSLRVQVLSQFYEAFETTETLEPGQIIEVLYFLERAERNPYEVIVRDRAIRKEVAKRTLKMEEIQLIPGAQGDVIRVIQNMPGVARTPFGLGLLVIRGASPQDTGVFLDGHRLPLLFHFGGVGGVTSVVNSRIIDELNFYPGGFSPMYGRASGGAVELNTRGAATDRIHGEAQLDFLTLVPITASVFLEGPVSDDPKHGAFVLSVRRSSIDGIFSLASQILDSAFAAAPRYFDYQARYDLPLGSDGKRKLSLFAYGSDDEIVIIGADSIGPNSSNPAGTQSRTYFHRFNPSFTYRDDDTSFRISPIVGFDFTNTETDDSGTGDGFRFRLSALNAGMRVDASTRVAPFAILNAGGDVLYVRYETESEVPAFPPVKNFPSPVNTDLPTRRDQAEVPSTSASLYTELQLEFFDERLKIWPGLRLDIYDFRSDPSDILLDQRLLDGRTLVSFDPRVTVRYDFNDDFAVKGQIGLYRQTPFPFQFYLNADLPLQSGTQASGGFELELIDQLRLDVQGFYRYANDIPKGVSDQVVVDGQVRPVGLLPILNQRSYGMEVLLRLEKRWGLFGWIAYTLARAENKDDDELDWQANFTFDQTHNLNVIAVYELGLNWDAGLRFRYVTGGAIGSTLARWYDADRDGYSRSFGDRRRAPDFHQLDLFIKKRFVFDEWYFEAYLDVQNVYNRTNTEFFIQSFDFKTSIPFPGLPIFPSIGIRGVF